MNPYQKVYTDNEMQRIHNGQQALLARWRAPPFSTDQTIGYTVRLGQNFMEKNVIVQEICIMRASRVMTPAWERELARLGLKAEFTDAGEFRVFVPHSLYLNGRWLPFSWDWSCLGGAMLQVFAVILLVATSYTIGM